MTPSTSSDSLSVVIAHDLGRGMFVASLVLIALTIIAAILAWEILRVRNHQGKTVAQIMGAKGGRERA